MEASDALSLCARARRKALGFCEKSPFLALAAADKVRYAEEMESYTPPVAE